MKWLAAALALWLVPPGSCGREQMPPTIQEATAQHAPRFMELPGVVSVGIGLDDDGTPVIVVGLDRERPETRAVLPQAVDGHRVKVQVVGQMRAR